MRISIVSLAVAIGLLIAGNTVSANTHMQTERKTEFGYNDIASLERVSSTDNKKLEGIKQAYSDTYLAQIEYNAILNRWKEKQIIRWATLPEEPFIINASAYTAAADECGKSDGITASGIKVEAKRTLACPPEYPFGARIEIEGMGVYTCEDRGGAIKGNHFDIYMETKAEAFAFGRQNLLAHVVE